MCTRNSRCALCDREAEVIVTIRSSTDEPAKEQAYCRKHKPGARSSRDATICGDAIHQQVTYDGGWSD